MTTTTFNTEPRVAGQAPKLQSVRGELSDALDAFAAYQMQRAVPASEQRRAQQLRKQPLQDSPLRLPTSGVSAVPGPLTVWQRAPAWSCSDSQFSAAFLSRRWCCDSQSGFPSFAAKRPHSSSGDVS